MVGICCILLVVSELVGLEREKSRFDSLRDPHLYHILGTGLRSAVQDARVTVTVCRELGLQTSVPEQPLFCFGARSEILRSRACFFSYAHSVITHMSVLFPMLLFFAKCKDLKASLGKAGGIAQLEEGLPHMQEALGLIPAP